jgi:hypothetical protein
VGFYDAVRLLMDEVHDAHVQEYGAHRTWQRVASEEDAIALLRAPHVEVIDAEPEDWTSPSAPGYVEGPLHAVARAYRRECRWDTAPGPPSRDYMWLCVHEPRSCIYDADARALHIDGKPRRVRHRCRPRRGRRAGVPRAPVGRPAVAPCGARNPAPDGSGAALAEVEHSRASGND